MGRRNLRVGNYSKQLGARQRRLRELAAQKQADAAVKKPPPPAGEAAETPAKENPYTRMLNKLDRENDRGGNA